jgi:hypothetical protein
MIGMSLALASLTRMDIFQSLTGSGATNTMPAYPCAMALRVCIIDIINRVLDYVNYNIPTANYTITHQNLIMVYRVGGWVGGYVVPVQHPLHRVGRRVRLYSAIRSPTLFLATR